MFKKLGYLLVKFYKISINPLLKPRCIFTPCCSAYMMQAINSRGFFVGFLKGIARICRCNPFSKGGFDPVKVNFKGRAKWIL